MPFDTNFVFKPGQMTVVMDGGAGSSGKGKIADFVGQYADNWQFCCNGFMSNAAHWVILPDGTKYLYQSLNSVAHLKDKYEKMYICGGAVTEIEPLLREIKEHKLTPDQLGIHPITAIVQQKDIDYEAGRCDFEGNPNPQTSDMMKIGSTLHGVGAARARRILRRSDVKTARDYTELADFICWTDREIVERLDQGQAGLLEIAQGYQLSYLSQFYPKTTSRNCTVMAGLDDCGIPPCYLGNVIINFRTFPIRVNSNKFIHEGKILTSPDMSQLKADGKGDEIEMIKGDSGACYDDQEEITWDQVTEDSNIKTLDPSREIREITSLTKLERRVYTWSKENLKDAVKFNRGNGKVYISVNFINYVDAQMEGRSGSIHEITSKASEWIHENIASIDGLPAQIRFLGTGPTTNDMIQIPGWLLHDDSDD